MSNAIALLGRQPAIGLAELESLYGADTVQPVANGSVALLQLPVGSINFQRLGGVMKLADHLDTINGSDWTAIERSILKNLPTTIANLPDGKIKLGVSAYGLSVTPYQLNGTGLKLKKALKSAGRSVRIVPNSQAELNSAQVLHNRLTGETGFEIILVRNGAETIVGRTTSVQDIDAYAARDQGRPKRDARVGMLPPKLAQTIINLAAGTASPEDHVVLDPFCGTGVILQEALLMGYGIYGTDIEQRMIDYSSVNLDWLDQNQELANPIRKLEAGDATNHHWNPMPAVIACEGYLGQPFASLPAPEKLADVRMTCNLIAKKFLQNAAQQLSPGSRLCIALPAWQVKPGQFQHLSLLSDNAPGSLDHLEEMGYNRVSFKHVKPEDLVYARADQIVARELLVLTRK